MAKYRKKPVIIEAFQFGVDIVWPKWALDFLEHRVITQKINYAEDGGWKVDSIQLEIATLEGTMVANTGDYIIKGVQGEIYSCKPDIFEQTYEVADTNE